MPLSRSLISPDIFLNSPKKSLKNLTGRSMNTTYTSNLSDFDTNRDVELKNEIKSLKKLYKRLLKM